MRLEEPYRSRALPPGGARYWSWLFAAPEAREPLLGIYALLAEWRALMDPATDPAVARVKVAWWREEMDRLAELRPLHPICNYLAGLPHAAHVDFAPLARAVEAAAAQIAGAPLERGTELQEHADALWGGPLQVAAEIAGDGAAADAGRPGIAALAAGRYLAHAASVYVREAQAGRIPFAVDELLREGIENDDLVAGTPPRRLARYLEVIRARAIEQFERADGALPGPARPALRHVVVLATLGAREARAGANRAGGDFRLSDLYNAWQAARRAAAAR